MMEWQKRWAYSMLNLVRLVFKKNVEPQPSCFGFLDSPVTYGENCCFDCPYFEECNRLSGSHIDVKQVDLTELAIDIYKDSERDSDKKQQLTEKGKAWKPSDFVDYPSRWKD